MISLKEKGSHHELGFDRWNKTAVAKGKGGQKRASGWGKVDIVDACVESGKNRQATR